MIPDYSVSLIEAKNRKKKAKRVLFKAIEVVVIISRSIIISQQVEI